MQTIRAGRRETIWSKEWVFRSFLVKIDGVPTLFLFKIQQGKCIRLKPIPSSFIPTFYLSVMQCGRRNTTTHLFIVMRVKLPARRCFDNFVFYLYRGVLFCFVRLKALTRDRMSSVCKLSIKGELRRVRCQALIFNISAHHFIVKTDLIFYSINNLFQKRII